MLEEAGYEVRCSDVRDGVYGQGGIDVFSITEHVVNAVTNPPVREAAAITEHLLRITTGKLAVLMPFGLLPSLARRTHYEPPRRVHLFCEFLDFLVGGDPDRVNRTSTYWAWFVWEKGYSGPTEVIPVRHEGEVNPVRPRPTIPAGGN